MAQFVWVKLSHGTICVGTIQQWHNFFGKFFHDTISAGATDAISARTIRPGHNLNVNNLPMVHFAALEVDEVGRRCQQRRFRQSS
jgi:hypothetical protein